LKQLSGSNIPAERLSAIRESVIAKSCICHGVGGCVTLKHGIDQDARPTVCCGPNIVNFSEVASLEEMIGHIYGRLSLLADPNRPHMFIRELSLYVDYFRREFQQASEGLLNKTAKCFLDFRRNLITAIEYYQGLAEQLSLEHRERFLRDLDTLFKEIEKILPESSTAIPLGVIS
jgi:hypothetical protein